MSVGALRGRRAPATATVCSGTLCCSPRLWLPPHVDEPGRVGCAPWLDLPIGVWHLVGMRSDGLRPKDPQLVAEGGAP